MLRLLAKSAVLVCCCGGIVAAQQDPMELLLSVRRKVMETVDRLPKYMCTETIDRSQYRTPFDRRRLSGCDQPSGGKPNPKPTLATSDRLRLDVAIAPQREMYSWHGANRFDDRTLVDIVNDGAISTGEFGGYLIALFGSDSATFAYHGETKSDRGRTLVEFGFTVPKEKSTDEFGTRKYRSMTGYDGTILVDPKTFDLVSLHVRTERLPEETGVCYARSSLDYEHVQMNGADFLLPSAAKLSVELRNGNRNENRIVYSGCREFHADSKVSFDGTPAMSLPANNTDSDASRHHIAAPGLPLDLPPGLPFRLKLAEDIESATAAAGDPVRAVLASALAGVPAGTAVNGRIVRIRHTYSQSLQIFLEIRLESIEFQGETHPFSARRALPAQRFNSGSASSLRQRAELGTLDAMESAGSGYLMAVNVRADHLFRSGTEMKWLTARAR